MKKKEMLKELSALNNLSQTDTRKLMDIFLKELTELLRQGDSFHVRDFGSFKSVYIKARTGYHPLLKKKMRLPQKRKIKFTPSLAIKKIINE